MNEQVIEKTASVTEIGKFLGKLLAISYLIAICAFIYALLSWSWNKLDNAILAIWIVSSVCGTAYIIFDELQHEIRIVFRNLVTVEDKNKVLNLTRLWRAIKFISKDLAETLLFTVILLLTFPFWFLYYEFLD